MDEQVPQQQTKKKKRSGGGRTGRRRRRKLNEIHRLEQQALVSTADAGTCDHAAANAASSQVLPGDRSHVWPAVTERRRELHWDDSCSDGDGLALQGQLGYLPGNVIRIAARCRDVSFLTNNGKSAASGAAAVKPHDPVVAQLYPLVLRDEHTGGKKRGFKARKRTRVVACDDDDDNDRSKNRSEDAIAGAALAATGAAGDSKNDRKDDNDDSRGSDGNSPLLLEPFPTTYWLTHPLLRIWVSQLELEGYGAQLERRLRDDPAALRQMTATHAAYGHERWRLLTDADAALVQERGWTRALRTGVAGNHHNFGAVKCLHAHAAHRLAGHDNIVGEWVLEELERRAQKRCGGDDDPTEEEGAAAAVQEAG